MNESEPPASGIAEALAARARELGFAQVGFAPATPLDEDLAHLRAWLADGCHGDMAWLARDPERRADPGRVLDGCRTVVVLTMPYLREPLTAENSAPPPAGMGRVSRYARTRDYHRVIEKRLRKLARMIDTELVAGARSRGLVDYGPAMERPWAARAGLGFIGKHTLHIDPATGSFHFLAVLLTTAVLIPATPPDPVRDGCGNCRRCIDACPTGAITEPWKLDARRCISYLTIEKQGPLDPELADQMNGWVFGCDICQEVCPYNRSRGVPVGEESPLGPTIVPAQLKLAELINHSEEFIAALGEESSPLKRAGAESLRRNALAIAKAGAG